MIGMFTIDSVNNDNTVGAHAEFDNNIYGVFYLPPLNRKDTSGIQKNDIFFGVLDENSGYGALIVMVYGHDFAHKFDYNITVNGEMSAISIKGASQMAEITLSSTAVTQIVASAALSTPTPVTDALASVTLKGNI